MRSKAVWERRFPSQPYRKNGFNAFAASTPAVDKDRLYVTWTTPDDYLLVAFDRETGAQRWQCKFGPFVAEHGFGASPILFQDLVIVPNDQNEKSSVVAIECATGRTRWTAPRRSERAAYSTPMLYQTEGGRPQLILTSSAHGLTFFDEIQRAPTVPKAGGILPSGT